jgi:mono/diheme cytochrome c family protein
MMPSRGFVSLSVLVAGLLAAAGTSDGASPRVGNAVAGKAAFTEYCSICHGVAAQGFIGPKIAGVDWTVPGLHAIVRGGVGGYGGMPAFNADAVTDGTIADIAAYLASERR